MCVLRVCTAGVSLRPEAFEVISKGVSSKAGLPCYVQKAVMVLGVRVCCDLVPSTSMELKQVSGAGRQYRAVQL